MSFRCYFNYEGSFFPLNASATFAIVAAIVASPVLGIAIIVNHIIPGIPITHDTLANSRVLLASMLFFDPVILGFSLLGLIPIIRGKDTVTKTISGYFTSPTSVVTNYTESWVFGDAARCRGKQRLFSGLFVLATKWGPLLVAMYVI